MESLPRGIIIQTFRAERSLNINVRHESGSEQRFYAPVGAFSRREVLIPFISAATGATKGTKGGGSGTRGVLDNLWIVSLSWTGAREQLLKFAARDGSRAIQQGGIIISRREEKREPLAVAVLTLR